MEILKEKKTDWKNRRLIKELHMRQKPDINEN